MHLQCGFCGADVLALQTAANSLAISGIRERQGVGRCCRSFRAVLTDELETTSNMARCCLEQSVVRESGRVGPLLFNALGHVARDGDSA